MATIGVTCRITAIGEERQLDPLATAPSGWRARRRRASAMASARNVVCSVTRSERRRIGQSVTKAWAMRERARAGCSAARGRRRRRPARRRAAATSIADRYGDARDALGGASAGGAPHGVVLPVLGRGATFPASIALMRSRSPIASCSASETAPAIVVVDGRGAELLARADRARRSRCRRRRGRAAPP